MLEHNIPALLIECECDLSRALRLGRRDRVDAAGAYEDMKSADFVVQFPSDKALTLYWSNRSHSDITDIQPRTEFLTQGTPFRTAGLRANDARAGTRAAAVGKLASILASGNGGVFGTPEAFNVCCWRLSAPALIVDEEENDEHLPPRLPEDLGRRICRPCRGRLAGTRRTDP